MKIAKVLTALLLALCLCLTTTACGAAPAPAVPDAASDPSPAEAAAEAGAPADAAEPEETPAPADPAIDPALPVRVMTLNGTTGFGMAGLISKAGSGEAALSYRFSVETDPSVVTAALVSGDCDIAALPTNAAAALYNKTGGKVQLLALNTRGVLYLVTDGSVTVESFADLEGQTVYVPAQNPSFIFSYLCRANGVNVTLDNSYAQPAELSAAAAAGQVSIAVLPEPILTVTRSQNPDLTVALDLGAEWDKVAEPGSLVQGCVVVRSEFAGQHPAETARFLEEYGESVALLTEDPAAAAQRIEEAGIFAKAAVAEKALPRCSVCFVTGEEMRAQMRAFLEIMAEAAPASIGGAVPGDDFYWLGT